MARGVATRFAPGVSGNPGGTPRNAAIQALARRYTVDAVRALVEVARLPASQHAAPKVAAARELIAIGHGTSAGAELTTALHMHLLAVQQIVPPDQNDTFVDATEAEDAAEMAAFDRPGMLPAPRDDLPDDALPLWDAYRVRRENESPPAAPDSGGGEGEIETWEPMPWPKQP